jgi:hypothetical protein
MQKLDHKKWKSSLVSLLAFLTDTSFGVQSRSHFSVTYARKVAPRGLLWAGAMPNY